MNKQVNTPGRIKELNIKASAIVEGFQSHLGKRRSYSVFLKEFQRKFGDGVRCPLTFYSFLSAYTTKKLTPKQQAKPKAYPALSLRYVSYQFKVFQLIL